MHVKGKKKAPAPISSCEIKAPGLALEKSARIAYDPFTHRWTGTVDEPYKTDERGNWLGITRVTLLGPNQPGMRFHVRYFEIEPGGMSSCEKHIHEHVVMGQRGRGVVEFDNRTEPVLPGDVIYVAPGSVHQFRCEPGAKEPFGFLCLVNADRDKPEVCE